MWLLRTFIVWSYCISIATSSAAQELRGGSVLALEFVVQTPGYSARPGLSAPDYIVSYAWSGDGRRIALLFWTTGIHILDVATRKLIRAPIEDRPLGPMALSRDASLLLVTAGREARLYATESTRLLARVEPPLSTCVFTDEPGAVFISETDSVWIGCSISNWAQRPPFVALHYRLPSLDLIERLEAPPVSAPTFRSKGALKLTNNAPVSAGFTLSAIKQPESAQSIVQYTFDCLRLDTKTPCFKGIPIGKFPLHPWAWAVSDDLRLGAVSTSVDLKRIDIFETANARLLRSIPLSVPPSLNLRGIAFAANGRMLIGAFDESKAESGGLVSWDVRDGERVHMEHPLSVVLMGLSPDRRSLLVVTKGEIRLYTVVS